MIVKVCGLTSAEQARDVVECGVDAIGINLYPGSARFVDDATAQSICRTAPRCWKLAVVVGVVPSEEFVRRIETMGVDAVQLHGDEPPSVTASLCERGVSVVNAIRLDLDSECREIVASIDAYRAAGASHIIVDARSREGFGGTGHRIDPTQLTELLAERPLIVAGGLTPDNLADVLALGQTSNGVEPGIVGVDVASGVEISPGNKDVDAVAAFVRAARNE